MQSEACGIDLDQQRSTLALVAGEAKSMTLDELKELRRRVHKSEEIQREIARLKERIACIGRATGGFTFDCDNRGMSLGYSEGLRTAILQELERQLKCQEAMFSVA